MKKTIAILFGLLLLIQSCTAQNTLDSKTVENLVTSGKFTFMAERAIPTNYDVINVISSMPNSTSSRMLDLSYGYALSIKEGDLISVLPYFGRSYNPGYGNSDKNSLRFTSKEYSVDQKAGKNGSTVFTIVPRDVSHIRVLYLDVYKNGRAYLSVNANDRVPISFDGYIMRNEDLK